VGDIRTWLEANGFARFGDTFEENEIDGEALLELTEEHLKDFGIALGPRLKLLKAIESLRRASNEEAPASLQTRKPGPLGQRMPEAERRQLTVLFCDLVGSTELAARLDPEDLRAVMRGYHAACADVIGHFDGYIAKFLGDGVLVYFGWPTAHEDDAERAVRAGLQLVDEVARLDFHPEVRLQARAGIATGIAVVGDLIGEGAAQEAAVVGEVPNLAARLQALAGPGGVVIGTATRRLLGGLFDLEDLGPKSLKGFAEPLIAWLVVGEGEAEARFEARHIAGLTPLVGRGEEIALLLRRWQQAMDGEGQAVLLSGEPGIGKSRIVREVRARLEGEPHVRMLCQCSPHHTTSPLHPVIDQLERAAGFARDDPPEAKLDKLEALLARGTDRLDEAMPLIAALLGVSTGERYPLPEMTPQRQKQRTLEVLVEQLEGLAGEEPVLFTYEDAHWIDPTTQELLGLMIERLQRLPILLLITCRPEFVPPWPAPPHVSALALTRLGRREGAALVEQVVGDKTLPDEIASQIVAKTDGVPLFVEELTKTVVESGLLTDAGDHYELAGPLPPLAIPSTLHDSLLARLDRLAPVKEVAQIGAVIGREFSHELLATVADRSEAELLSALDQLVAAELVFRRGVAPEVTYIFKHALVQDVAYQSLLKSKRQQLHTRIAEALEGQFPDTAETQPELLAQHFTDAGLAARAIPYWRRAGALAAARSANVEAIAHLSKGLELVGTLPETPEQLDEELALRLAIGGPLIATKGNAAPEVERTYSRAWALCEQLGRSDELFPVLRGLWTNYLVRGELQRAFDLAKRLVVLADEERALLRRAHACRALGSTLFFLGRLADAFQQFGRGIKLDGAVEDFGQHRAHALLYGEHPGVFCRMYQAWALWHLGYPDQALEMVNSALDLSYRLAQPHSTGFAPSFAAVLHNWRGEFAVARMRAEMAIEVARTHRMSALFGHATVCRGFALVGLGQQTEGIAQIRSGLADWNATGARLTETHWLGFIAEAHIRAGQFDDAITALDRAAETAAVTGECHCQAELDRLRGVVLVQTGERTEAASWFQQAIDTARKQQAKSLELRGTTSLGRLWVEQGEWQKARDLLAPIYGWFTEGFDTADLKDAKALLDELA
jgi:class 3 adenylate cyclase/predicted ATPase